jgi:IS1 family transposase
MNQLSTADRTRVVSVLVEGNSLRATARITGIARMTVEKLLRDLGAACARHHNETVRGLKSQRVQCDEIWSFIGAKAKNTSAEKKAQGWGDCWTWTAIDADSKLMVSYMIGPRIPAMAYDFMQDVASRITNRVQLTTDGLRVYLNAVDYAFGIDVDYAMLDKQYGGSTSGDKSAAVRYSPAKFISAKRAIVTGDPNPRHISTSYVERSNLTMRMHMRRFTRLTNGFSKKLEMHGHNIALHFAYYNFCKIHQTLRVTPAMEAGISDHVWSVDELVSLLNDAQVGMPRAIASGAL